MKEAKRKATEAQRRRIRNMLMSGLIDFDEAEGIIAKSRDPRVKYWEERFPGKGEAIMSALEPLYGGRIELMPAVPDLEERLKDAIFWREVSKIKTMGQAEAELAYNTIRPDMIHRDGTDPSLWEGLYDYLKYKFREAIENPYNNKLWGSRENVVPTAHGIPSFSDEEWESNGEHLWDAFDGFLGVLLHEEVKNEIGYFDDGWCNARPFYALGFAILGCEESAMTCRKLMELNLAGNFPFCFDKDGTLLVLVADTPKP